MHHLSDETDKVVTSQEREGGRDGKPLTLFGLPNREDLLADIAHILETDGPTLSVVFIDLDGFKALNDELGHEAGDKCLETVVAIVGRTIRTKGKLYRYGGDEFVPLLPNFDALEGYATAERIRKGIDEHNFGSQVRVTASIGVVCLNDFMERDPLKLVAAADRAMYASKQGGKNKVTLWSASLSSSRRAGRAAPPNLVTISKNVEGIIKHISSEHSGSIEVVGVFDKWPALVRKKHPYPGWTSFKYVPYPTGGDMEDQRALLEGGFKAPSKFSPDRNETIALACDVSSDGQTIDYYPIKYQTKLGLIEQGLPHATVSAGAVILDMHRGKLLLHIRSEVPNVVHEAVGNTHCFLGSLRVPSSDLRYEADMSAEAGARRECFEESGSNVTLQGGKIAMVKWIQNQNHGGKVLRHSGLDLVYLGAEATETDALKKVDRYHKLFPESTKWEGYVEAIALEEDAIFKELTERSQKWFPPGIAHCLLWLALGAYGTPPAFADNSRDLYARIVTYYASRGAG